MSGLTLRRYEGILEAILARPAPVLRMYEFIQSPPTEPFAMLRHDVEWDAKYALRMARIEADRGIRGIYYFRGPQLPRVFNPAAMRQIEQMGHEVGYHYETLDLCDGDYAAAERLFAAQLREFRDAGIAVRTVCQHGNPRKKKVGYKVNADLFRDRMDHLCRTYDLVGEAYLSVDFERLTYVSDVGIQFKTMGGSSARVIEAISAGELPRLYMLTHPDYWSQSRLRAAALYAAARGLHGLKLNSLIGRARALLRSPRPAR